MKNRLPFHADWHKALLNGKRKAIAWGLSGNLYYYLLQSPYSFTAIIDGVIGSSVGESINGIPIYGPDLLRLYGPDDVVIVIFSDLQQFGKQIIAQIKSYGDFPYISPYLEASCDPSEAMQLRLEAMIRERRARVSHQSNQCVVLYIHSLVKGGAERQMVLLAIGLRQLGWDVHLISVKNIRLTCNHWEELLIQHGVVLHFVPGVREYTVTLQGESYELARQLAPFFEPGLLHGILTAHDYIHRVKPRAVIAYLEDGNVIASMAAIWCGVEHILISGRNVAPIEFPEYLAVYDEPRLAAYYRLMTQLPGIVLSVNSTAGARSYATWLRLPKETFPVVKNAVLAERAYGMLPLNQLDIAESSPIIMGVMRLSPEKSPCRFVDVAAIVIAKLPQAHAILIGDGPLRPNVIDRIAEHACHRHIHWVGIQDNIFEWLSCANVLVSTSTHEGMSNVILEAQALGCPVIATDIPGNRETVIIEKDHCLIPYGEWDLMAEYIIKLLVSDNRELSISLIDKMNLFYSPRALAERTLALI